jgi:putative transposase
MVAVLPVRAIFDDDDPNAAVSKALKCLHYPLDIMLTCVRWYVAYPLSLRHMEEMMLERAVSGDHSTVHRWAIQLLPVLEKAFRPRKRAVGRRSRMDETYIRVKGEWRYLYRAVDKAGDTVDFLFRAKRDKAAARRYFEKALARNGIPETVTIAFSRRAFLPPCDVSTPINFVSKRQNFLTATELNLLSNRKPH